RGYDEHAEADDREVHPEVGRWAGARAGSPGPGFRRALGAGGGASAVRVLGGMPTVRRRARLRSVTRCFDGPTVLTAPTSRSIGHRARSVSLYHDALRHNFEGGANRGRGYCARVAGRHRAPEVDR